MTMSALAGYHRVAGFAPRLVPMNRDAFRRMLRDSQNVAQWRARIVSILGRTPAQANAYGTKEAAFQQIWDSCPFA